MTADDTADTTGEFGGERALRIPAGVDPAAERARLENVSETRGDVFDVQANLARGLRESLGKTEAERRQLDLTRSRLAASTPSGLLDLMSMIRAGATMEELLQRVLEEAVRLFECEKSSVLVPDEAGRVLRVAAARSVFGQVREDLALPIGQGAAGRAYTTRQRLVITNTAECDYFAPHSGDAPSEPKYLVVIPLLAEGACLGVMCLERPLEMPANEERIEQLFAFAGHAAAQLKNIQVYQRLMQQVDQLSVLCEVSRELSSSLQHERLLQRIVESAVKLLDCGICSLMLFEDDKQYLRIRYAEGLNAEVIEQARPRPGEGVAGWVAEQGKPLLIEDIGSDPRFSPRAGRGGKYTTGSLLSVPLMIGTEVVGVLNVNNKANNAVFTGRDLENLTMLASQAAVSIENARLYETLQRLAVTDPLTKLFRRNYFEEQLETELGRCQRYNRPLSVMMLDIDHFKRVNDSYGHPGGDQVLVALAGLLRRYGRKDDVIARYGGEEFVVLLVETDADGAKLAAERVRSAAEAVEIKLADGRVARITVSLGTASFPADAGEGAELVQRADLGLYAAKHGGRNRVCGYYQGLAMPAADTADDR